MWVLPSPDPVVELTVASHGMSKGISQTDGPQMIPKTYLQIGDVQLGGQWKNVSSNSATGEFATFLNVAREFGALQLTGGITYKALTGAPAGVDSDCVELAAGASSKLGKASIKLNAIFSPDDIGSTRRSLYLEGGPSLDVTKQLRLSANLGHRWREDGTDYLSMNAGAAYTLFRGFALDLRYYRTNRADLGDVYRQRLVMSGHWSF